MLFGRKKKVSFGHVYDRAAEYPMIRCSICTGEQVAGFRNLKDNRFTEVALLKNDKDLQDFLDFYGLKAQEVKKEY